MKIRYVGVMVVFCFSFRCFSFLGYAQQDAAPAQPAAPGQSAATAARGATGRRISLDVVVNDKSGKAVSGLHEQDFTILDDKRPQPIASFHANEGTGGADEVAVQVIFLVDAVNTSFRGVGLERQFLDQFLRQNGGQLPAPTSLVLLTDTSEGQTEVTRDGKKLADDLQSKESGLRFLNRSQGFYGGENRVQISLSALGGLATDEATKPGRKLLIWLSPGWPLLSGPGVELSKKDQEGLFGDVVRLSTDLREARITLYTIDPLGVDDAGGFRTFYYKTFLKGVTSANKVQSGNLGLQVLATQTGGRVLNSSNDIAKSIASCLEDAKASYKLSFDSAPADNPNEYHNLEVKIDKTGLTARTRTGYYAQR
jgi:VWFA-related protein